MVMNQSLCSMNMIIFLPHCAFYRFSRSIDIAIDIYYINSGFLSLQFPFSPFQFNWQPQPSLHSSHVHFLQLFSLSSCLPELKQFRYTHMCVLLFLNTCIILVNWFLIPDIWACTFKSILKDQRFNLLVGLL